MIPTMILVGLVLGFVPRHWRHRWGAIAAVAFAGSLAFGFAVDEPVAGTALAALNAAIGVLVGWGSVSLGGH